jgi:hypothetical protein
MTTQDWLLPAAGFAFRSLTTSIFSIVMALGPSSLRPCSSAQRTISYAFGDRTPNRHDTYYKYWEHHLLSLSDADSFCHPRMVHLDEANVAHDVVFNAAYSLRNNEKKSPYAAMRATRLRNVLKESWRFYNAPLPS